MKTIILFMVLTCIISFPVLSQQKVRVTGMVMTQDDKPIPGVTVYLVHPKAGRSNAVITDRSGEFLFPSVPIQTTPYYIEIYWGEELMYRNKLTINGEIRLGKIRL